MFDIELGDGIVRKLPFNNGDNAVLEAEKLCNRDDIERGKIEYIRNYIS